MFEEIGWVDEVPALCWVDDLTDPGHDYFDPEDEENYEFCGEMA